MKKVVCVLLAVLMLFVCACQGGGKGGDKSGDTKTKATESGMPIVNETVNLSVSQCIRDVDELDFNTMAFYKEYEETTGVHVNWEQIKQADWLTKLNLMFASKQFTDVIAGGSNGGAFDTDEYGANQHLLLPLDDYLEKWMPNYYPRLSMNNVTDSMYAPDGKMYYIGYFRAEGINTSGHYFLNTTWMDRVGVKKIPETVDELTELFRLFKTQDPNQNGQADEVPFEAMFTGTMAGLIDIFRSGESRNPMESSSS